MLPDQWGLIPKRKSRLSCVVWLRSGVDILQDHQTLLNQSFEDLSESALRIIIWRIVDDLVSVAVGMNRVRYYHLLPML